METGYPPRDMGPVEVLWDGDGSSVEVSVLCHRVGGGVGGTGAAHL